MSSEFGPRLKVAMFAGMILMGGLSAMPSSSADPATGQLGLPIKVNAGSSSAYYPAVAYDDDGFGTAVWVEFDSVRTNLWGAIYQKGVGWQDAVLLERMDTGNADSTTPAMARCGDGSTVVVWGHSNATQQSIWAVRMRPDRTWEAPQLIEPFTIGPGDHPVVGCDAQGNAVAVWHQSDGAYWSVAANRYVVGVGWGTAAYIEPSNGGIYNPYVAVEAGGNATALWGQFDGAHYSVFANQYTVGTGWGAPVPVEQNNVDTSYAEGVTAGPGGSFLAAGLYQGSSAYQLWTSRFTPGSGWAPVQVLDDAPDSTPLVHIAAAPGGAWRMVWVSQANATPALVEATARSGLAFGPPVVIFNGTVGTTAFAQSSGGGAVAAWQKYVDGRYGYFLSRLTPGQGWSAPLLLYAEPGAAAIQPDIAVNAQGEALCAVDSYSAAAGAGTIWAVSVGEPYPPPLSLAAPLNGATTGLQSIRVAGTTEPGATVHANGVMAAVEADGAFAALVPLEPGANLITVTSADGSGNLAYAWVNVTFNDPVPALEADLAAALTAVASAQADLAAAQGQLTVVQADANATQVDLDAATANVTAAQSRVAALEGTAAALRADLNRALADQAAAAARAATLEANLNATRADLNASNDRIDALENRGPGGDSGLALILAAIAIAVGFAALGAAVMMGRRASAPRPVGSQAPEPAKGGEHDMGEPPGPRG